MRKISHKTQIALNRNNALIPATACVATTTNIPLGIAKLSKTLLFAPNEPSVHTAAASNTHAIAQIVSSGQALCSVAAIHEL